MVTTWGEPTPEVNDQPFVQDAVIADIESRKAHGIAKYGTALQPFNGRNAVQDAYEDLAKGYLPSIRTQLASVFRVGDFADRAAAPSNIRPDFTVGTHRLSELQDFCRIKQFADFGLSPYPHQRQECIQKWCQLLGITALPCPEIFVTGLGSNVMPHDTKADCFVQPFYDIAICHRAEDANDGDSRAVFALARTAIEAPFTFE